MNITSLYRNDKYIEECAELLLNNFSNFTFELAKNLVINSIDEKKISLILVENDTVIGWICGLEQYNIHIWEIQPIVVNKAYHKQGLGSLLIDAFEKEVKRRQGVTVILGVEDENEGTTLGGKDIYNDTFEQIKNIKNLKNNPFEFYIKKGFQIVGVIPDANGYGKPDILMAKPVQ